MTICTNPNEESYKDIILVKVIVQIIENEIPIIADKYADKNFGRSCLKITPAYYYNDYGKHS